MGAGAMMQTPPPPPGFQIVGSGGVPPPPPGFQIVPQSQAAPATRAQSRPAPARPAAPARPQAPALNDLGITDQEERDALIYQGYTPEKADEYMANREQVPAYQAAPGTDLDPDAALARYRAAHPDDTGARVVQHGEAGYPGSDSVWDERSGTYVYRAPLDRQQVLGPNLDAAVGGAAKTIPFLNEGAAALTAGLFPGSFEDGMSFGDRYRSAREVQAMSANYDHENHGAARNVGQGVGIAASLALPGSSYINGVRGASQVGRAALVNGGYGAIYGAGAAEGGLGDRLKGGLLGLATGAGAGAALTAGGQGLLASGQRAAANPSPARELSRAGVNLTPGQMTGGALQRVEDGLTSIPIIGDSIRSAQRRGLQSFDTAATNAALEPIGVQVTSSTGREGVRAADDAVSQAYQTALAGTSVAADAPYQAAITAARRPERMTPELTSNLNAILDNTLSRFDNGPVAGDVWKQVDSELAASIRSAERGASSNPAQRILRDRLQEARDAVGGMMERANPDAYEAVRAADRASAQYRLVRKASSDVASAGRGGDASPATLNRAVVAAGGERRAARGESLLQDLTDNAMQVLPRTVPDSGTPFRSLLTMAGVGGGAASVGANPTALALGGGLLGAGSAIYSQTGQNLINAVYRASSPGAARQALGELQRAAARDPALVPLYEEALQSLQGGRPASQGLLSPEPAPMQARQ